MSPSSSRLDINKVNSYWWPGAPAKNDDKDRPRTGPIQTDIDLKKSVLRRSKVDFKVVLSLRPSEWRKTLSTGLEWSIYCYLSFSLRFRILGEPAPSPLHLSQPPDDHLCEEDSQRRQEEEPPSADPLLGRDLAPISRLFDEPSRHLRLGEDHPTVRHDQP
jgi:hypothetical protein